MKIAVAVILGAFSGLMIYMLIATVISFGSAWELSPVGVVITFFLGWAISSYFMLRGAKSVSKVASRGFLFGAGEWLASTFITLLEFGKALNENASMSGESDVATAALAGTSLGAFLVVGVKASMAVVCLLCFAVTYFMSREIKVEDSEPTKRCPHCAESIKAEASKCRYCGAAV